MLDRGPYPLSVYPGQGKIIQLLGLDDSPFVIPAGATGLSRAIDVLQNLVANLTVEVTDAAQGLIKVTLADTEEARSAFQKRLYYDLILSLPNGLKKYLPTSSLTIQHSPSQWTGLGSVASTPIPAPTPQTGGGTGTTGTGGGTATSPTVLYIQDQIWVDSQNKRVRVQIEKQPDGRSLFKLTEII